jgi:activator of HSP90 ATPase
MPKTIVQKVVFKNVSVKDLYDLYMNAKKHSAATGAQAKISAKEGSSYSVHNGYITGKNLKLVKDRLIVQTWRAKDWSNDDYDSTFIISLEQQGKNAMLHAIHTNVPDKHAKGIDKGWHEFYWEPWKKHLAGKPVMEPQMM